MRTWHGSWSRSATISGFRVRRSRLLHCWLACLLTLWALAVLTAPLPALTVTLAIAFPAGLLRGRLAWFPRRLRARHLWLDVRNGSVTVAEQGGRIGSWTLRNWLRHPWLVVLYVEAEADGTCAMVVLAADGMERRGHRQLRYLLGVRTVGPDSAAASG